MSSITGDFLTKLASLNDETFNIFLPSTKVNVKAKPLTLKQQKDIVSTAVGGIKGAMEFSAIINNIITENTGIDSLTVVDRVPVIISLRKQSLGNTIKLKDDVEISLDDVVSSIKKTEFNITQSQTIKESGLEIDLQIPTLKEENNIIRKCITEIEKINNEASAAVGLIYIFELTKYIRKITIDETSIEFENLKIGDRIKIVESLPLTVYNKLSTFLKQITQYESSILTIGESSLTIDASFFDTSIDE
jgi:hypothetical protein